MPSPYLRIDPTRRDEWRRICDSGSLYAIVDACDEPSVLKRSSEAAPDSAVCLYRGGAEEQYAHVAPYLMRVDHATFDWIAQDLWTQPWGIFIYSPGPLENLRTHFRRFLTVKSSNGKKYLFRFYDPGVLRSFVQSCNDQELKHFFGPVRAYGAKQQDAVACFRLR
ncbi:MAG: DUF4123 domain-containing protein [Acidobacteriia bacterium]|nr:DUF4123 domain-containing protein [Terriglobia bacterium]